MAVLCHSLEKNGMVRAWRGHGMASVYQTRAHCVNQMEKTHSKPLAAQHDRGMAWARQGHSMLCVNQPLYTPHVPWCTDVTLTKIHSTMLVIQHIVNVTIMKPKHNFSLLYRVAIYQQWFNHKIYSCTTTHNCFPEFRTVTSWHNTFLKVFRFSLDVILMSSTMSISCNNFSHHQQLLIKWIFTVLVMSAFTAMLIHLRSNYEISVLFIAQTFPRQINWPS
jgi:hypothetical protein